jgi:TP901 family phage tail tape measure protein
VADYSLGKAKGTVEIGYDGKGIGQARDDLGRFVGGSGSGGGGGGSGGSLANVRRGLQQVATVSGIAAGAIATGIGFAVNAAIEFEQRISAIGAVSGATGAQIDQLRKKALQLGADTTFSAAESAQAMEELVKAGLSVEDVLNGAADATVALAAAGGIDLPAAATIAANAMNQFNLAAKDLPKIADLIAGAANASAIDVSEFGLAMAQAGAVAHLIGVNFSDLATAIALMGNAGIRGSDAGTSLKTMLQNLQPTTKKQIELMTKLGIVTKDGSNQFFDQQGKLKSLADVSGILNNALKGMTDGQKAMALETIFGTDAIRAAAVLAGQGAEGFHAMATAMGEVTAGDVAAKRMDNVAGSIEQLKGSVETAAIAFGTALLPAIRAVTDFITMLVNKFSALDPKWQKLIAFAAVAGAALLGLIAVVAGVGAVIAGLAASLVAIKIAAIIGAIVIAIIAIAAAVKLAWDRSQEFRDLLAKLGAVAKAIFATIMAVVRPIAEFFKTQVIPAVKEVAQTLMKNLAPAFKAIGDFIQNRVLPAWQKLRAAIEPAMPTIIAIAKAFLEVGKVIFNVLGKALGFIIPLLLNIIGPIFSVLISVIAAVISAIPGLVAGFKSFINVLMTIGKVVAAVVIAPFWLLFQVGKFIFEGLVRIVEAFVAGFMRVWNFLWPVTKAVFDLIAAIVGAAFAVLSGMFQIFWAIVTAIWDALWKWIIGPVIVGFKLVMDGVGAALSWIQTRLEGAWIAIKGIWDKLWSWLVIPIMNAFNAIKDFISVKMDNIKAGVKDVWDGIVAFFTAARNKIVSIINNFSEIVNRARDIFNQMKDAAIAKAQELISWVAGLPGRLLGALGNIGGMLVGAGRSLISGFWDGMKSIWNSMVGWLEDKMSTLRGLWPFSPAKWGPFSGRGWVLYSGRALMEGFAAGMDDRVAMVQDAAKRALAGVSGSLPTDFSATVGAATTAVGATAGISGAALAGATSTTNTSNTEINLNVPLEDLRSIRDVQDLLDFIDRLRNDSRRGLEVSAL